MKNFLLPIGWMLGYLVSLGFRFNVLWLSIASSVILISLQFYVCVFNKSKE